MPKVGRTVEVAQLERVVDTDGRYIDLAVQLRVLTPEGEPGQLIPGVFGGRWDTWLLRWVSPQPDDLRIWEWTIQEQQIPALLETPTAAQFVAYFSGRQAGKTRCAVMDDGLDWVRSPGRGFGIVSLNFKTSRDPEDAFRSLLAPWWRVDHNKTDRVYTLPHGAQMRFRSEEAIESLRGPSLKRITLDEAAYMQYSAFTTSVGCGAAAKDFRITLATTPKREQRWIREINEQWARTGTLGKSGAAVIHRLRTEDNPRRNRELLEKLKATIPTDIFEQEFEGKIVPPSDQVYCVFKRSKHVRKEPGRPDIGEPDVQDITQEFTRREFGVPAKLLIGWDFGVEAAAICKVYRDRETKKETLWVVGEMVEDRTTTEHHARKVASEWGPDAVVITDAIGVHDNADGRGGDTAAIKLLKQGGQFKLVVPHGRKNPDVNVRVRTVSRLLDSPKHGHRLYIVPERCLKLVDALENQRMGTNGKPVKDGTEHIVDALGYLCLRCFPISDPLPEGFTRPYAQEA